MSYRFGDFEIEPLRHELRKSGILIAIEPQVFALLLYLVENRDHLVGKEELNREIWQGRVVSEWAMSTRHHQGEIRKPSAPPQVLCGLRWHC